MLHGPRVAAYGICERAGQVLLARWVSPDGAIRHWALPGGRVEHGEDPIDAVAREVREETGYDVEVERLLGVDSRVWPMHWLPGEQIMHGIGVFYRVNVVGGELRNEVGGSTDLARWVDRADLTAHLRAVSVDIGLALNQQLPATGHVPAIPAGGLRRH